MNLNSLSPAIIRAGGGRGFIVRSRNHTLVLTAAHCLPWLDATRDLQTEVFSREILAPIDCEPAIPVRVLWWEPCTDVAVIGRSDDAITNRAGEYSELVRDRPSFMLAQAPEYFDAYLLSTITGQWEKFPARRVERFIVLVSDVPLLEVGMSGSPICLADGRAVGILRIGRGGKVSGPNPLVPDNLPHFLIKQGL